MKPQKKNNNQEKNLFSKIWKKKKEKNQPKPEEFLQAPPDKLANGVRNAKEKGECIAVNLSEPLYLFH